jgi:hypothetical protein
MHIDGCGVAVRSATAFVRDVDVQGVLRQVAGVLCVAVP